MKKFVWYCPEWDCWRISSKQFIIVIKDSFGTFHTILDDETQTSADFYLMGSL